MHRPEPAIKWLQVAAEEGFPCYPLFEGDANLDNLRKDARFISFMATLKRQWEHYNATLWLHSKADAVGATILSPPEDKFWRNPSWGAIDREGFLWTFRKIVENVCLPDSEAKERGRRPLGC